jgi:hypothetical protein
MNALAHFLESHTFVLANPFAISVGEVPVFRRIPFGNEVNIALPSVSLIRVFHLRKEVNKS